MLVTLTVKPFEHLHMMPDGIPLGEEGFEGRSRGDGIEGDHAASSMLSLRPIRRRH